MMSSEVGLYEKTNRGRPRFAKVHGLRVCLPVCVLTLHHLHTPLCPYIRIVRYLPCEIHGVQETSLLSTPYEVWGTSYTDKYLIRSEVPHKATS